MTDARDGTDRIRLTGISATGHHGVLDHERRDGQRFVADVALHVDTRPAAAEDRLDRTVDYGVLATQVADVLAGEPAALIETVAERVAAVALAHDGVQGVDVVLHKPQAPITVPFEDVTVEIHRDRSRPPVVAAASTTGAQHAVPDPAAPSSSAPDPATTDTTVLDTTAMDRAALEAAGAGVPVPLGELLAPAVAAATGTPTGTPTVGPAGTERRRDLRTRGAHTATDEAPVDRLDRAPDAPVDVVLALGSNVGDSREVLRSAVSALDAVDGLEVTAVSPLARTAAVGGPEQPDFLNAVVLARTTLSPRALLAACHEVEARHGRERLEHWGPRTLDVDIVLHGSTLAVADDLELPHPRAHQRAFVLVPWAEVDPGAVLPGLGGGPVADLARTAPDRDGIRWMALDWWQGTEALP